LWYYQLYLAKQWSGVNAVELDGMEQLHVLLGRAVPTPALTILNVFHVLEVEQLQPVQLKQAQL